MTADFSAKPNRFFRITSNSNPLWGECWIPEQEFVKFLAQDEKGDYYLNWTAQEIRYGHIREFSAIKDATGNPALPQDLCIRVVEYPSDSAMLAPMVAKTSPEIPIINKHPMTYDPAIRHVDGANLTIIENRSVPNDENAYGIKITNNFSSKNTEALNIYSLEGGGEEARYINPREPIPVEGEYATRGEAPKFYTLTLDSSGKFTGEKNGWNVDSETPNPEYTVLESLKGKYPERIECNSELFQKDPSFQKQFDINQGITWGENNIHFETNSAVRMFRGGVIYRLTEEYRVYGEPQPYTDDGLYNAVDAKSDININPGETKMNQEKNEPVIVYVWDTKMDFLSENKLSLGHASMQIGDDTYISHWPEINENALPYRQGGPTLPDQKYLFTAGPYRGRTLSDDIAAENRPPAHCIVLNGLDTEKMKNFWEVHGLQKEDTLLQGPLESWSTLDRNCSTTVADTLKTGIDDSKKENLGKDYNVWTPERVKDFSISLGGKEVPFESADPRNEKNIADLSNGFEQSPRGVEDSFETNKKVNSSMKLGMGM